MHERTRLLGRVVVVLAGIALLTDTGFSDADGCRIATEHGGMLFPVDRLDPPSRCLIGPVVNEFTTSGLVGPVQTPIAQDFFEYLLDRPVLLAALVERFKLGNYKFTVKGDRQYWVDDGEGTQALLTLVYRDATARIYHLDGYHKGRVLPSVKAKAVVFLHLKPGMTPEGRPFVESRLVAYTKIRDSFLAALVRMLRPLVGGTVTRKLSRGFDATIQLGTLIAQDPDRVARGADTLEGIDGAELKAFHTFLRAVPLPPASTTPQRATP